MSGGYQVDLDYLQDTVKKLQRMLDGLSVPHQKATYNTSIQPEEIGSNFVEADTLHGAHAAMATQLQQMIKTLQSMISDFAGKTQQVGANYHETEQATRASLS